MNKTTEIDNSDFLNALLEGNRGECSRIMHSHLKSKIIVHDLYEKVIRKSLYEVGKLWERNQISVATEHLASAIVEALLNELYMTVDNNDKGVGKVIVSCVENEHHQIGIKMVSDIFELNGWSSFFLGANTPTNELMSFTQYIKPDMLAISQTIYSNISILEKMIRKINEDIPNLSILVGGQAFQRGGQEVITQYSNVTCFTDLYSIDAFIKNYKTKVDI